MYCENSNSLFFSQPAPYIPGLTAGVLRRIEIKMKTMHHDLGTVAQKEGVDAEK
jgi:hypothetical protein